MSRIGTLRAPKQGQPDEADDPYCALLQAIVRRAVLDACGQVSPSVSVPAAVLQQEAQAWLSDDAQVAALLELTGLDSAPVVRQVRALLAETTPAVVPLPAPGQLVLFGDHQ